MKPRERAPSTGGTPVASIIARKAEYSAPTCAVCKGGEKQRNPIQFDWKGGSEWREQAPRSWPWPPQALWRDCVGVPFWVPCVWHLVVQAPGGQAGRLPHLGGKHVVQHKVGAVEQAKHCRPAKIRRHKLAARGRGQGEGRSCGWWAGQWWEARVAGQGRVIQCRKQP